MENMINILAGDEFLQKWRLKLDPYYHDQYRPRRQQIQNDIVRRILSKAHLSSLINDGSSSHLIVLTGPLGVGKTTIGNEMVRQTMCRYLYINPDEIRNQLPESKRYQASCPHLYTSLTNKETETITELLLYSAISLHIPIIFESFVQEVQLLSSLLNRLKVNFCTLQIDMIHINATIDTISERIVNWKEKGIFISMEEVSASFSKMHSLSTFKSHFSECYTNIIGIDNNEEDIFSQFRFPKILFPWHLDWSRMLCLLKLAAPNPVKQRSRENRLIGYADDSDASGETFTATSDWCTSGNGSTDYHTLFSGNTTHSNSGVSYTFQTAIPCASSSYQTASSSFTSSSYSSIDTNSTIPPRVPIESSWMIERLRNYHESSSKRNLHTGRCCFLCRVDKLPTNNNTHCTAKHKSRSNSARETTTYPSIRLK